MKFKKLDLIMKVFVKNVKVGAKYQDKIYDYWIIGQLENGLIIKIFDADCLNLQDQENNTIDCLILAFYAKFNNLDFSKRYDKAHPILTGRFIGDYKISEKWYFCNNFRKSKMYPAVQTINGIILMDFWDDASTIKIGDILSFTVGRLDLLAWRPID